MIYGNIFPNKTAVSRIIFKSLLGVFMGGILLPVLSILFLAVKYPLIKSTGPDFFSLEILAGLGLIVIGVLLWTLMFASIPAILGGVLLSGVIYRDFKLGYTSKNTSLKRGVLIGGLTGLFTSLLVIFTVFYDHFDSRILFWTIPVTLIASLMGAWGGLQVHKEIMIEFSLSDVTKEIIQ